MSDGDINDTRNIDPSVGGTLFQRYFTGRHEASVVAPDTFFMTADYVYSLQEFGLSEAEISEKLAGIIERFGFRPEDVPERETRELL
jgi:hypothetical protein